MFGTKLKSVDKEGMGPILGRWNLFLEKNFPLRAVMNRTSSTGRSDTGSVSLKALGKRVLADQVVM